jgi:DNA-directed RNA polymerase subunit H (RpoH/RPB5)
MLSDRGYTLTSHKTKEEASNADFLPQPFILQPKKCLEWMQQSSIRAEKNNETVIVKVWLGPLGVKDSNIIMTQMEEDVSRVIIVSKKSWITVYSRNFFLETDHGFEIELFNMVDLVYNITHHFLQPKMEYITDPSMLKHINNAFVQDGEMKKHRNLLESDPLTRYYNGKQGDVFKITPRNGRVHYTVIVSN